LESLYFASFASFAENILIQVLAACLVRAASAATAFAHECAPTVSIAHECAPTDAIGASFPVPRNTKAALKAASAHKLKPDSALTRLETRVALADHENFATAANHLAVTMTRLG
jgi:hypothetical protein